MESTERGYQDRRFDTSEYPAGKDGYYKDSYSRHVEKASHRMTGIHFQKDSILIQPILIRIYICGKSGIWCGSDDRNATEEIQCRQDHFDHLYPFDWASNCSSDSTWSSFGGIWSSGRTCNISNSDLGGSSCNRSRRDSVGDSRIWSAVLFPRLLESECLVSVACCWHLGQYLQY